MRVKRVLELYLESSDRRIVYFIEWYCRDVFIEKINIFYFGEILFIKFKSCS